MDVCELTKWIEKIKKKLNDIDYTWVHNCKNIDN